MQTIDHIHLNTTLSISFDKTQYESLHTKVNLLIKFLESYPYGVSEYLKSQIRDKASHAEYIIEAFVKEHVLDIIEIFSSSLDPIIEDLTSIIKETTKFEEMAKERIVDDQLPTTTIREDSSSNPPNGENTMVGFDEELYQIIDMLIREESSRQVIPIVGMGGSGKTLLAKNVYDKCYILRHFDSLAWVTISQAYNVREILLETLSCLGKKNENGTMEELGEKVHKSLWRRRYLIVMDDMWDINVWDKVIRYFPNDNNGSRIIVTSRDSNMPAQLKSSGLKMIFLDEDKSWNLFCQKTFPQGVCPPEYEEIGKKIVRNCKGLPLSIVVVGGLLVKSKGKRDYWEYVANDVNSVINFGDDERCMKILSLSYHHLPIHLKPCFLYVGVFPEDTKIRVSHLVNLWVVEGFIKQNGTDNLEEVGKGYLKDLISRNVILVHKRGRTGNVKYCKIHDVLRDLCLREAQKEKFIYIPEVHGLDSIQGIINQSPNGIREFRSTEEYPEVFCKVILAPHSLSHTRSLIRDLDCTSPVHTFKLLRILKIAYSRFLEYEASGHPFYVSQLINSRYLELNLCWENRFILSSFSAFLLWNLQILIVRRQSLFVFNFWDMSQLRHLEAYKIYLPDPPCGQMNEKDNFVLENLQKLLGLINFKFSEEVVKRIPNIKKLKIFYGDSEAPETYCFQNIGHLHKLESLSFSPYHRWSSDMFQHLAFPHSLKRLSVKHCYLDWKDITTIGSLLHLEFLVMIWCMFRGSQGEPCHKQFYQLRYLGIESGNCGFNFDWLIDEVNFPCLEHLWLNNVLFKKEMFLGIGDITTLQMIELVYCNDRIVFLAKEMQEEQEKYGKDGLLIDVWLWRENEDLMRLASPNFRVRTNFRIRKDW